jgi:anti-sigma factor RsiW
MSMTDETLQILISKYLDGEISPDQERTLQDELEHNRQARELLERLKAIHQCSQEVVESAITEQGDSPGEIFDRAWQQKSRRSAQTITRAGGWLRFAAGLAAGLLLGMVLHFALPEQAKPPHVPAQRAAVPDFLESRLESLRSDYSGNAVRSVDWYSFTDEAGDQWLVEGLRENIAKPAVYYGDL